jgi:hypothetical protein
LSFTVSKTVVHESREEEKPVLLHELQLKDSRRLVSGQVKDEKKIFSTDRQLRRKGQRVGEAAFGELSCLHSHEGC